MDIKTAIRQVTTLHHLGAEDMTSVMREVMSGNTTDAQNAAFLVGLQMKGVQVEELLGGAIVMRELVTAVAVADTGHLVDTCGTGGSGSNKFNVSTAAALVAACAGARVAKHGNRGATSKSGSADVLEAAGVNLALTPQQVGATIDQVGVGFMFAPSHHSAMKHVIAARKEIGVRTVFNLLGPLTNPAAAPNQVLGVFERRWIAPLVQVLKELGSNHVLVVSSDDGLDEISISSPTQVGELKNGDILRYEISPQDFGLKLFDGYDMLKIGDATQSLAMLRQALTGEHEAAAQIVAMNAGAAIYVAGLAIDLATGIEMALAVIDSGKALEKLEELARVTQSLAS